jgi:hypothetical protein
MPRSVSIKDVRCNLRSLLAERRLCLIVVMTKAALLTTAAPGSVGTFLARPTIAACLEMGYDVIAEFRALDFSGAFHEARKIVGDPLSANGAI